MDLETIKKIAIENQKDDNWASATVLKYQTGDTAVYYRGKDEDFMQTEGYIVLDMLERGSVPVTEIAHYWRNGCLDDLSYYLKRALMAINTENAFAKLYLCTEGNKVVTVPLKSSLHPIILEKYGLSD